MQKDDLGQLAARRTELSEGGRTAVLVAFDGRAAGLVGMADAPLPTAAAAAVAALVGRRSWPIQRIRTNSTASIPST